MAYVGPLRLFYIRANVRAFLLGAGEYETFKDAFEPLLLAARDTALDEQVGHGVLWKIIEEACRAAKIEPEPPS
jgi:hypothetical protein